MIAPVARLDRSMINWLASHRCEAHGRSYLEHYACYMEECNKEWKLGYFDIEASNLKADFGYMFCWSIADQNGDVITATVTPEEILNGTFDRRIVRELAQLLPEYDRIFTFYGAKFDIPFVRTRALVHKLKFPPYQSLRHTDLHPAVKNRMKLRSNRMEAACDTLGIESKGHRLNPAVWNRALSGHQKSLDYIVKHNVEDVLSLRQLHLRLKDYFSQGRCSI